MVDKTHQLSIVKQCQLLNVPRSSFYNRPTGVSDSDLALMRLLDECYLEKPFYGSRRVRDWLSDRHDMVVNRKRIQRLRRVMGLETLYPKRNLSLANNQHKIYPYLLKGVEVVRSNQVWSTDITFLPMSKGFAYLVAVIDWYSRRVLSWRLATTLDASFCIDALEEAIEKNGAPEIFNTDQGSQFTCDDFISVLKKAEIKISMDGKGRWIDNVFIERLWRSVKYEEVYLKAYDSVSDARSSLGKYFVFYNSERRHQNLARRTPDEVYYQSAARMAA